MNLNNIKLVIEDPRLTNMTNSTYKLLIIVISMIIISLIATIIINSITKKAVEYRKISIITIIIIAFIIGLEYQGLGLYFKDETTKHQIQLISSQTGEVLKTKDIKKDQYDHIKKIKIKDALGEKVNQEDLNKIKDIMTK